MKCCLNGVHISEVPKFLAGSPNVTTHAIQLLDLFDAAYTLLILLQLCSATSYYDVYSPSISEYEDEDIPKIHLFDEKPLWDPSTKEYSEHETCMSDHQGQMIIHASVTRGPAFIIAIILYSIAYDAIDVIPDYNLATIISQDSGQCSADCHSLKTVSSPYMF